jgi:hypothetical protein
MASRKTKQPMRGTQVIEICGHCPTKKNGKKAWNGRVITDPEIRAFVQALEWRAVAAWGGRAPLEKAVVRMKFHVRDGRADADGKYTTMQDVLVKAKILRNDSIARVRRGTFAAEITGGDEWTEIRLREVA